MNLDERLSTNLKELQKMYIAQEILHNIEASIVEKSKNIEELEEIVDLEYWDIEALENNSISSIFKRILGDDKEQMDMEKQEYLDAVLNYKDAKSMLKLLTEERKRLKEEVAGISEKETIVEEMMRLRERAIEKSNAKYKSEFLQYCTQADQGSRMRLEIIEARIEGLKCKREIERIIALLKDAKRLRTWGADNFKNTTAQEKSSVDKAIKIFYELKIKLQKFEKELGDIYKHRNTGLKTNVRKFDKFIDVYYNYLINDWLIKERISSTLSMMEALQDEILRLLGSLDQKEDFTNGLVAKAEAEKKRILEGQ